VTGVSGPVSARPAGVRPAGVRPAGARSIDQILAAARGRLSRVTPEQAHAEIASGAVLVDIRPAGQRAAAGEVPGSWIVERNHLDWRFDPESNARLPFVADYGLRVIVICAEGYTSSLAAAALLDLGLSRATDVIGGYAAWAAAGLPTATADEETVTVAPGATSAAISPQIGHAAAGEARALVIFCYAKLQPASMTVHGPHLYPQ